jgi:hypothetical protein
MSAKAFRHCLSLCQSISQPSSDLDAPEITTGAVACVLPTRPLWTEEENMAVFAVELVVTMALLLMLETVYGAATAGARWWLWRNSEEGQCT